MIRIVGSTIERNGPSSRKTSSTTAIPRAARALQSRIVSRPAPPTSKLCTSAAMTPTPISRRRGAANSRSHVDSCWIMELPQGAHRSAPSYHVEWARVAATAVAAIALPASGRKSSSSRGIASTTAAALVKAGRPRPDRSAASTSAPSASCRRESRTPPHAKLNRLNPIDVIGRKVVLLRTAEPDKHQARTARVDPLDHRSILFERERPKRRRLDAGDDQSRKRALQIRAQRGQRFLRAAV